MDFGEDRLGDQGINGGMTSPRGCDRSGSSRWEDRRVLVEEPEIGWFVQIQRDWTRAREEGRGDFGLEERLDAWRPDGRGKLRVKSTQDIAIFETNLVRGNGNGTLVVRVLALGDAAVVKDEERTELATVGSTEVG